VSSSVGPRLAAYLADRHGRSVEVLSEARIYGGASRETYRLRVRENGAERGLILRRDPVSALIDTERTLEFQAYRAVYGLPGVPVPEAIALELDPEPLDRPFFLMEEIENGATGSLLAGDPYGPHRKTLGHQFWTILGRIHAADPRARGLAWDAPDPREGWSRELLKWEQVIDEDEREPQPVARAAIRHLRLNPPPPAQKVALVHGDYRTGNFLHDGQGKLLAVLDWEMAHIGDPLEDLAWALDPLWRHFDETRAGGMLPPDRAIALWQAASGCRFDAVAFRWWALFASLKGLAIWLSSARAYADGRNTDPVLSFTGWYCTRRHEAMIAARLAAAPRGALPEAAL
jgi:aminoglycoside phosphotransferase (APT) family kinase protein